MSTNIDLLEITSDTWLTLINRVNQVSGVITNETMTACTTSTGVTVGDAQLKGTFVANTIVASGILRGGNSILSDTLYVPSSVVFSGATINSTSSIFQNGNTTFTGNTIINANNTTNAITIVANTTTSNITVGTSLVTFSPNVIFKDTANVVSTLRVGTNNSITSNNITLTNPNSVISIGGTGVVNSTFANVTCQNANNLGNFGASTYTRTSGNYIIQGQWSYSNTVAFNQAVTANVSVQVGDISSYVLLMPTMSLYGNTTQTTTIYPGNVIVSNNISIGTTKITSTFAPLTSNNSLFFNGTAIGNFPQTTTNNIFTGNNTLNGTNTNITSNTNISANLKVANTLSVSNFVDYIVQRNINTGTGPNTVFSYPKTSYTSGKINIEVKTTYGNTVVQITEALVASNTGIDAQITTYGVVHAPSTILSSNAVLGTFVVDAFSTANVDIKFVPNNNPPAGVTTSGGAVTNCSVTAVAQLFRV